MAVENAKTVTSNNLTCVQNHAPSGGELSL